MEDYSCFCTRIRVVIKPFILFFQVPVALVKKKFYIYIYIYIEDFFFLLDLHYVKQEKIKNKKISF